MQPDTIHGSNTAEVNFLNGDNNFYAYRIRPKTEFLKIIDNYFTRFGYKVNQLKVPNITHRKYWNYVQIGEGEVALVPKTADSNSPKQDVVTKMNEILRRGVTIFVSFQNYANFSVDNYIN